MCLGVLLPRGVTNLRQTTREFINGRFIIVNRTYTIQWSTSETGSGTGAHGGRNSGSNTATILFDFSIRTYYIRARWDLLVDYSGAQTNVTKFGIWSNWVQVYP